MILLSGVTEHTVQIQWTPLVCDSVNKARVIMYVLQYQDTETGMNYSVMD